MARWVEQTRALAPARALPDLAIVDHLPIILTRIADLVDAVHTRKRATLGDSPDAHAHDRLARGFDLEHVVAEYALLRGVILDTWEKEIGPVIDLAESKRLDQAIDLAVAETAIRFARGRERVLKALDRISQASLGTADVDTFLRLLAKATLESTESVETVVVLLREGERLRVRVAVGLEADLESDFSVAIGEGFAGKVAQTCEPLFVADAAADPTVKSPIIRSDNVRALYGVPLVHHDQAIGVAHMGSRTARTFSEDDKLLFRSMVARASSVIVQAQLVEDRDRALALLDALLAAAPIGIGFIDRDLRYVRVNAALAALNGRPVADHLGRRVEDVVPDAAELLEPLLRKVLTTGEAVENLELETIPASTPNEPHSFLATYFPVRHGNQLAGIGAVMMDITAQKRSVDEKALLAAKVDAERRWVQAILENIPVGVMVAGADGEIVFSNSRASAMLGSSPDRVGRSEVCDLTGRRLVAEDRPLGRALRGESVVAEELLVPGEGGSRTLRVHAEPLHDLGGRPSAVASLDDVTEARREAELRQFLVEASKALAETLEYDDAVRTIARVAVPRIADWCVVESSDARKAAPSVIVHADPTKAERVHELRRLYPRDPKASCGIGAVLRTGKSELYPRIDDPRAQELQLRSAMIVPLVARGTILGAVTFATAESGRTFDEKDLAAAEELARRAALALDNARLLHGMKEAVRHREEVLAVVSHDLRNALNSVLMAASSIVDRVVEPVASKRLGIIVRGAQRMNHLISSLLDVASIQAGRLRIDRSKHDVVKLVGEAFELAEPLATERQLRLVSESGAATLDVDCDRERVLQVLSNLLGNAIKFAHANTAIAVRVEANEQNAVVAVTNQGPGIAEGELARLFEPYWSASRHEKKGTGLGLYIAKNIVEAHGGRIWADSRPLSREEGQASITTFTFTLPRA